MTEGVTGVTLGLQKQLNKRTCVCVLIYTNETNVPHPFESKRIHMCNMWEKQKDTLSLPLSLSLLHALDHTHARTHIITPHV